MSEEGCLRSGVQGMVSKEGCLRRSGCLALGIYFFLHFSITANVTMTTDSTSK